MNENIITDYLDNMKEIKFPCTIQDMSEDTGIPERTLRKYCEQLGIEKFGHGYMITGRAYKKLITRDAENKQYNKKERKTLNTK